MSHNIIRVYTKYAGLSGSVNWVTRNSFQRYDLGDPTNTDVQVAMATMRDFWSNIASLPPIAMSIQVQSVAEIYDQDTGLLQRDSAQPLPTIVNCLNGTSYVMGSGIRCMWETAAVLYGRHMHGSTAIVPMCEDQFTDGDPNSGAIGTVNSAAASALSYCHSNSVDMVVYKRPNPSKARAGYAAVVTGNQVLAIPGVLKRRRT